MPQNTVLLLYFIAVCARLGAEILRAYNISSVSQICLTGNINRCLAILGHIFYTHAQKTILLTLLRLSRKTISNNDSFTSCLSRWSVREKFVTHVQQKGNFSGDQSHATESGPCIFARD